MLESWSDHILEIVRVDSNKADFEQMRKQR